MHDILDYKKKLGSLLPFLKCPACHSENALLLLNGSAKCKIDILLAILKNLALCIGIYQTIQPTLAKIGGDTTKIEPNVVQSQPTKTTQTQPQPTKTTQTQPQVQPTKTTPSVQQPVQK